MKCRLSFAPLVETLVISLLVPRRMIVQVSTILDEPSPNARSAGKSRRSIFNPGCLSTAHCAVVIVAAVDHGGRRIIEALITLQQRVAVTGDRGDAR